MQFKIPYCVKAVSRSFAELHLLCHLCPYNCLNRKNDPRVKRVDFLLQKEPGDGFQIKALSDLRVRSMRYLISAVSSAL